MSQKSIYNVYQELESTGLDHYAVLQYTQTIMNDLRDVRNSSLHVQTFKYVRPIV